MTARRSPWTSRRCAAAGRHPRLPFRRSRWWRSPSMVRKVRPNSPGQPLSARLQPIAETANMEMGEAVARIETHLQQNPEDGPGLGSDRAGLYPHGTIRRCRYGLSPGDQPARRGCRASGEFRRGAGHGLRGRRFILRTRGGAFEQALDVDPASPKARFFLATAAQQDGDEDRALAQISCASGRFASGCAPGSRW